MNATAEPCESGLGETRVRFKRCGVRSAVDQRRKVSEDTYACSLVSCDVLSRNDLCFVGEAGTHPHSLIKKELQSVERGRRNVGYIL